jgi:hypothetical protein
VVLVVVAIVVDRLCARVCVWSETERRGAEGKGTCPLLCLLAVVKNQEVVCLAAQATKLSVMFKHLLTDLACKQQQPNDSRQLWLNIESMMLPSCSRSSIERTMIVKSENSIWVHQIET